MNFLTASIINGVDLPDICSNSLVSSSASAELCNKVTCLVLPQIRTKSQTDFSHWRKNSLGSEATRFLSESVDSDLKCSGCSVPKAEFISSRGGAISISDSSSLSPLFSRASYKWQLNIAHIKITQQSYENDSLNLTGKATWVKTTITS